MFTDGKFLQVCEHYREIHEGKTLAALTGRYSQVLDRTAELESYARRSNSQDDELDQLGAERTVLDVGIADRQVAARSQLAAERAGKIAEISRVAMDPANLEGPASGSQPGGSIGAPALVKQTGDRLETPAESLQRMRTDPWRDGDGGPLSNRLDSSAGLISRCHTALEGMEERLTRSGAQMLANLLSERPSTFGPYELRTEEDVRRSAAWVLALSDPRYATAFEKIIANPELFRSGAGVLLRDDGERQAYWDVISRAALIENTGTGGTY